MKYLATIVLMIGLLFPLGAKDPTPNDVTVAVAAITDTTICAVAAFLNTPSFQLPGTNFYFRNNETLPSVLSFDNADIGTFLPLFMARKSNSSNFLTSLLDAAKGPLNDIAIQYLTVHAWEEGHALLKGAAVTGWGDGMTLASLMGTVVTTGKIPPITITVDVNVKGRRVSTPVRVEGEFMLHSDDEGYFEVQPVALKINGKEAEV